MLCDTMFMHSYYCLHKVCMVSFLLHRGYPSRWFRIKTQIRYLLFAYTRNSVW